MYTSINGEFHLDLLKESLPHPYRLGYHSAFLSDLESEYPSHVTPKYTRLTKNQELARLAMDFVPEKKQPQKELLYKKVLLVNGKEYPLEEWFLYDISMKEDFAVMGRMNKVKASHICIDVDGKEIDNANWRNYSYQIASDADEQYWNMKTRNIPYKIKLFLIE